METIDYHSHPLYNTYQGMKQRCFNKNANSYPRYGGRGITVCDRWLGEDGMLNFFNDVGERPEGCSLDRTDNDGNYEPGNIRWATSAEQARNRKPRGPQTDYPHILRYKGLI